MSDYNRDNIIYLLSKTGSIIEKYEAIAKETGVKFNIFEIVDISAKEVIICRFLHELLSPLGRHGQGIAYLKLFLNDCLVLSEFSDGEIENARIEREYLTETGRKIDLVINIGKIIIPIEVKIYADDGEEQCFDYYQLAKEAKLVYLTLDGRAPSEESAKGLTKFNDGYKEIKQISFADDILNWIERCLALPETIRKTPIREILIQFSSAIKKLSNQLEDRPKMELVNLLTGSSQNMRNAVEISDILNDCKAEMTIRLFKAFETEIDKCKLPGEDYVTSIKKYYRKRKETWPSINYHIANVKDSVDIWFRIEIGYGVIYAGLCVALNNESHEWQLNEAEEKQFDLMPEGEDWWSTKWGYMPDGCQSFNDAIYPNFRNHNDAFFRLFDEEHFNEFVKKSVAQINKMWEQWVLK